MQLQGSFDQADRTVVLGQGKVFHLAVRVLPPSHSPLLAAMHSLDPIPAVVA